MKILISGSAGLIGSHLYNYLSSLDGHDVYGMDDFSGGLRRIGTMQKKFFFCDIQRDFPRLQSIMEFEKFDIIYHLACHPYEGLSQFCPMDVSDSTSRATIFLLKESVNKGVKRFVFASSMARYGTGKLGGPPPFSEDYPRDPVDVYGAAKCAAEVSLEAIGKTSGLEYNICVPHNVCGGNSNFADPYRNVLAIWVSRIFRKRPPFIYSNGEQKRAFSHVSDIIPCIAKLGLDQNIKSEIVNLGAETAYTLNEACEIVLEEMKSNLKPVHTAPRPREVKIAYCTVQKSKELLGFKETKGLREIIRDLKLDIARFGLSSPRYKNKLEITKNCPEVWLKKMI